MNIGITLICHNRPEYLRAVLASIKANRFASSARLFVVRDNATEEVRQVIDEIDWIPKQVFDTSLGVNHANLYAYRQASMAGAEYVCAVEDDTTLAPDCLQLVEWFINQNACMMNCFSKSKSVEFCNSVRIVNEFCPWVWAFKAKFFWDVLQKYWMRDPNGWDWSLMEAVKSLGIPVFQPALSRSGNVGRDGGVHYTREQFDNDFNGHVMSDGSHTDYQIVS